MLTELMDELIEDSPFLRQIHDAATAEGREEGREEGRLAEARALLRDVAQARFPELTEADLAPIEAIASLDRLHALAREVVRLPDAQAVRQALADARTS